MKVFAIDGTNLRRLFRLRSTIFFVIVFPILMILLLGSTFSGGSTQGMGVSARGVGPLGQDLEDVEIKRYSSEGNLVDAVARDRVSAGLVIPTGYDATLSAGDVVVLRLFIRPGSFALRPIVEAPVGEQSVLIRSARFAQSEGVASLDDALEAGGQGSRSRLRDLGSDYQRWREIAFRRPGKVRRGRQHHAVSFHIHDVTTLGRWP